MGALQILNNQFELFDLVVQCELRGELFRRSTEASPLHLCDLQLQTLDDQIPLDEHRLQRINIVRECGLDMNGFVHAG